MMRNISQQHSHNSALRPALELLEQRLTMDNSLGDILSSKPAVIELSIPADWSPGLEAITSDFSSQEDQGSFELTDANTEEAQAKDAAELSSTADDALLNFELIAGPFPDTEDALFADLPTAPQPADDRLDEFHLDAGLLDHEMQNKHTQSPIEPTDVTTVDRSAEFGLDKAQGWSPLESPVVIQLPAPAAGLLAAELPTRLPDAIHHQPLIPGMAPPRLAVTSSAQQASGDLKPAITLQREAELEPKSPNLSAGVGEPQTTLSDSLIGLALVQPIPRVSPTTPVQLAPDVYFAPQASLPRAPMAWTTDTSSSATRNHAALEGSSVELLADSANTVTPWNRSELADNENKVDPALSYFSDLVTYALSATRVASGVFLQGITDTQTSHSNDSELLPAVLAGSLAGELDPYTASVQPADSPADANATSWSDLLVLIVAGLLLPAYIHEPRVRNV